MNPDAMATISSALPPEIAKPSIQQASALAAQQVQKSFAEDLAELESVDRQTAQRQDAGQTQLPTEKARGSSDKHAAQSIAKNNKHHSSIQEPLTAHPGNDETDQTGADEAAALVVVLNDSAASKPFQNAAAAVDKDQDGPQDHKDASETTPTTVEIPELKLPQTMVLSPIPSVSSDIAGQHTAGELQANSSARPRLPTDAGILSSPSSEDKANDFGAAGMLEIKTGAIPASSALDAPQSTRLAFMEKSAKQQSEPDRADKSLNGTEPQLLQADLDPHASAPVVDLSKPHTSIIAAGDKATVATSPTPGLSVQSGPVPYGMLPIEIGLGVLQGRRAIEIRLSPDELGTVEIKLEISNDTKIKADISADRPETLALMIGDAPLLRSALDQAGITTNADSLQFSLRQDNGSNPGNGNGSDQRKNGQTPPQSQNEPHPSALRDAVPITSMRRVAGLLDVNI